MSNERDKEFKVPSLLGKLKVSLDSEGNNNSDKDELILSRLMKLQIMLLKPV